MRIKPPITARQRLAQLRRAREARLREEHAALLSSLEDLLAHYVGLVNSGDAGIWNPENEAIVIRSRALIHRVERQP